MEKSNLFHTRTQEPYSILLNRLNWIMKREVIKERDNNRCMICGREKSEDVSLHVHHKRYIHGLDPWEYKDSDLITLCEECHAKIHENCEIPIYVSSDGVLSRTVYTRCCRCNGYGWIPKYSHVANGICFRCHGVMCDEFIVGTEIYAEEHGISIEDIDYGYRSIKDNYKEFSNLFNSPEDIYALLYARVVDGYDICSNQSDKYGRKFVQLTFYSGRIITCLLDSSDDANVGDKLDVNKLLYRIAINSDGCLYVIIKMSKITE